MGDKDSNPDNPHWVRQGKRKYTTRSKFDLSALVKDDFSFSLWTQDSDLDIVDSQVRRFSARPL
jgi:hypothetical protein